MTAPTRREPASPSEFILPLKQRTVSSGFIEALKRHGASQEVIAAVESRNRRIRRTKPA